MTNDTKADTTSSKAIGKSATTKHLKHEYNPSETNWAALTFPTDHYGMTAKLRREFRSAIQRCHGSDEKFQQVLDNLEILVAWGQAQLEADKAVNRRKAEAAAARTAQAARREEFRARIQAGTTIRVSATDTGFIEQSPRNGAVLGVYDTAEDELGPVASMAQMMIAEGRDPNSVLVIDAFGRQGVGSGQTLAQLASTSDAPEAPAQATTTSLQGIRT